jgi:hypothetical protein
VGETTGGTFYCWLDGSVKAPISLVMRQREIRYESRVVAAGIRQRSDMYWLSLTTTKQWIGGREVDKRKLEQKLWPGLQEQASDQASLGVYLHCATRDRVWS